MDEVELVQLQSFMSDDIFHFLTTGYNMTQPIHSTHVDPTDPLEVELDALLLQCSNIYEQDYRNEQPPVKRPRQDSGSSSTTSVQATSGNSRQFALPKTEEDILQAKRHAIPQSTLRDTKYCITVWNEWCSHRLSN